MNHPEHPPKGRATLRVPTLAAVVLALMLVPFGWLLFDVGPREASSPATSLASLDREAAVLGVVVSGA